MALHGFSGRLEGICLFSLRWPLRYSCLLEVLPSERIAISDVNVSPIDLQDGAHAKVLSLQVAPFHRWEAMAPDQLTLWHAAVLDFGLLNLTSVILQIVVDGHLPHTEILQVCLDHRLLEIASEAQDMSVKGIPCRKLLELDVSTRILEHCARLAVWQGTRSPNILHFTHLHKFGLLMRDAIFLLDSHAIDQVPRILSWIVIFVLWKSISRQVGQRLEICR
mmetsp:Transcript_61053/g.96671  ORF Transcript_61053/g.96671 Transcript_61053/m.96671 type:complete len:221 (-) Transcript_61053:69-731(-)